MCDGMKLLKELSTQQKPLRCTVDYKCWCNNVDSKFTHSDDLRDCLSPEEMLKSKSQCFSEKDLKYLKSLLCREWVT